MSYVFVAFVSIAAAWCLSATYTDYQVRKAYEVLHRHQERLNELWEVFDSAQPGMMELLHRFNAAEKRLNQLEQDLQKRLDDVEGGLHALDTWMMEQNEYN